MQDWSKERGVATELDIDRFVASVGGQRLESLYPSPNFQNADYIFQTAKVVVELKILQTEFGDTPSFAEKEFSVYKDIAIRFGLGPFLRREPEVREAIAWERRALFRDRLSRVVMKASGQLRDTQAVLGHPPFRGLLWLVNDGFRNVGSDFVFRLLCNILDTRRTTIDGLIYVTNHYVDIPTSKYANLLWVPAYAGDVDEDLPDFVNWLGCKWHKFCEEELAPFNNRQVSSGLNILGTRPII